MEVLICGSGALGISIGASLLDSNFNVSFFSQGKTKEAMEEEGIQIPVVSVSCKYKSPAKFDDTIIVKTHIKRFNGIVVEIAYEVVDKKSGEVRVTGESSHCFVNDTDFKPINLKKEREDIYNKFLQAGETD